MEACSAPVDAPGGGTLDTGEWDGGVPPFAMSWQKLGMWLFLAGDALLFAGLRASYGLRRLAAGAPRSWSFRRTSSPI